MTTPASLQDSANKRDANARGMAVVANKNDDDTPQFKVVMFALLIWGGDHASTPNACLANVSNIGRS